MAARRPARKPESLTLRLLRLAALWVLAILIGGGVMLAQNFRGSVERAFDSRLEADLDNLIAAAEPGPRDEVIVLQGLIDPRFKRAFSGWYWQVRRAGDDPLEVAPLRKSGSLFGEQVLVTPQGEGPELRSGYVPGPDNQELRFVERDIILPSLGDPATGQIGGVNRYVFTVAGQIADMREEIARFEQTLIVSIGILAGGLLFAVFLQLRFGLKPLTDVSAALQAIRAGKADRLQGAFPAEIAPLADELNKLLQHNAEIVERARTHVGNLAHFLKTPLTVMTNEAAAQKSPLADIVRRQSEIMRRQVDHYLARARTAASAGVLGAATEVAPVMDDLARTLARMYARRGVDVAVSCPPGLKFRGEQQDFEEMAGNLLDNACKFARSRVEAAVVREGRSALRLTVSDDGPGLSPQERARVMERRGERLDESVPGSGLGLSIVRDISRMYGGGFALEESAMGGVAAVLTLPAVEE